MDYVRAYMPQAPKTHAEALEEFIGLQGRKRKAGRTRLLKALDSARYEKLRHGFGRALMHPVGSLQGLQAVGPRAEEPLADEARRVSAAQIEALKQAPRDLSELSAEALHELRLACKRLRYTLEFFDDILPAEARTVATTATELQDALGEVHDADVWSGIINAHADRREDDAATRRACKALTRHLAARRDVRLADAAKNWAAFRKPANIDAARDALAADAS
jgi:CHAD domain-containing protein